MELYWQDAYQKAFEGEVVEVSGEGEKEGKFVVLNKTLFYPQGGGQPCDTGVLRIGGEEYKVLFVGKFGGKISHEVDRSGLKIGDKVVGEIDWNRRYKLMRMHTATHLLSAIFHKDGGALITGNQLGEDQTRMDFSLENFDREKIQEFVDKANKHIQEGLEVRSYFISVEEALKDESLFRLAKGAPQGLKELRIVEIGDVDKQADGGTHIRNLKEVGRIVLLKLENKGKNNRRLYFGLD